MVMCIMKCVVYYWRAGASQPSRPTGAIFLSIIYPALMSTVKKSNSATTVRFFSTPRAAYLVKQRHLTQYTCSVLSFLQPTCKPLVMLRLAHHARSVKPLVVNVLPKARRLASGDSNGSVLAGGTFLPQKQRRRGRAAYLNAEFGTEHDEPPARRRQARHATSK